MDPGSLHQPGIDPHCMTFKAVVTTCDHDHWICFSVLSMKAVATNFIRHGILKIGSERATFLQLQPDAHFTAYKVFPQLGCNKDGESIIIVDLTGGYHKGQILRSPVGAKQPINIDICSGMGGWHVGAQALGLKFAVHIEQELPIAEVGARVTMTRIVDPDWVVRCDFAQWVGLLETGVTLVSSFQNDTCWEKLASQGIDLIAASLPCPPWSSLTPQIGLDSSAGQLFSDLTKIAEVFQPRMVVLENVEGLLSHDHWKLIVGWFVAVGFVVAHQSVDCLDCVCPMHRNRASVIFVNLNNCSDFTKLSLQDSFVNLYPIVQSPSAMSSGAILPTIPPVLDDFALIDPIAKEFLCDLAFWPKTWKLEDSMIEDRQLKLEARLTSVCRSLPCAVARYGFPDQLNPQSLRERGLVMMLIQHPDLNGQPRWITPIEHLTAMGWPIMKIFVPRDPKLARLVVGNTIAPIHALVTLARAAILRPELVPVDKRGLHIFDLMMPLLGNVPNLPGCVIQFDEDYIWVDYKLFVPRPITQIQSESLDEKDVLSNHGVVECSPTSVAPTAIDSQPSAPIKVEQQSPPDNSNVAKKRGVPFPVFASHQKKFCAVKPPQKINDCQLASSTPSNIVKVKMVASSGFHESAYAWFPNEQFTPHVLHEITHADGIKHDVLIPDTWITGTIPRGTRCDFDPIVDCLIITDATGSWKTTIVNQRPITVETAIRQVLPNVSQSWIQKLTLNQAPCEWDTQCIGGTLTVFPFKFKRILLVPELMKVINLFCDAFDTPAIVNSEHPLLQHMSVDIDWISTNMHSLQAIRMEPNGLILDFPFHCWTLHSVSWVPSRPFPVRLTRDISIMDTPRLPPIGRVMCVHPFTGKSVEIALSEVTHVCDLLNMMDPPIATEIAIVAEINAKRIDLTTLLSDIDLRQVIRFRYFGLPGGAPAMNLIRTELMAHGVPEEHVTTRAKAVITALGEPALQDIFQKHDPWAAIKSSCKDKQLRLVMPNELKEHQKVMRSASRSRSDSATASTAPSEDGSKGKGKTTKGKGKGKHKGKVVFDFDKDFDNIVFPAEGFVTSDGDAVAWVNKQQVTRDSTGICAMTLSDAQPFMHLRSFSIDPLAVLVVGHEVQPAEHVQQIAVPVTIKPDLTPHLMPCTLVQLGDAPVQYQFNGPSTEMITTPSCVLEILIEKDRCKHWCELFKPLDLLVSCLPMLRDTKKILSHWSWIWTDSSSKICPSNVACRLHGYIRVPDAEVLDILQQSGPNGLGVWPKTQDKKVDPRYAHIPLATAECDEVQALVQTLPKAIGFVCVGKKFRIRCLREDYAVLRQQLVPQGVNFDASAIQHDDLLFVLSSPVPLSASMNTLTDAIQQTGWKAVVVRPMGPSSWLLKASDDPPAPHVSVNGSILSLRAFVVDRPRAPITHFASNRNHSNGANPWASYKPTHVANDAPNVGTSMQRINDVEKELGAKLEQQMQQMMDTKMLAVENQLNAMESKNNSFQEACNQRFAQVEGTLSTSIQGLQRQIDNQGATIIHQMKELFQTYNPNDKSTEHDTPKRQRRGDKQDGNE